MTPKKPTPRAPYGWEMALAWCPQEDSPLLGDNLHPNQPAAAKRGEQAKVTQRYNRIAWFYDIYDAPMEWMGTARRRRRLIPRATGRVLEAGVGTGKNLPHYQAGVDLTGIDVSERMLARAKRRASQLGRPASLERADVTALPWADATFDTTVATCVFCSVAQPVTGLRELGRVTKPDGRILLLEHVRPSGRFLGWLADLATVVTRRLFGFRANRRTEGNITAAGLDVVEAHRNGIWREIIARPSERPEAQPDA